MQKKRRQNINPVGTWIEMKNLLFEMKNLLKQKFLPINHSRDLLSIFQDLKQGSRSIVEYYEEFMTMQARCALNETEDVLVDRYFHGLRIDIHTTYTCIQAF